MEDENKKAGKESISKAALYNMQPSKLDWSNPEENEGSAGQERRLTGDYEGSKPAQKHYGAQELNDAEKKATDAKEGEESKGGLETAKKKETDPEQGGFFKSDEGGGKGKGKGNFKGKISGFKKKAPLMMLSGAFMLVIGFFMGGGVTMPFSMISQFKETLDSIGVSNQARTRTMWTKQLMNTDLTKDPIHRRYFGFGGTEFKIQNNQKKKLMKQGIFIEEDFGGSGKTAMLFDDGSGKLKVVAANEGDIDAFKKIDPSNLNLKGLGDDIDLADFELDTSEVKSFRSMFNEVPDFRNGYIAGSRTWRGSVGAWFDSITVRFLQSNSLTRNRFKDFQERVKAENEGNTRSARKKVMTEAMETKSQEMNSEYEKYEKKEETNSETGEVTESADSVPEKVSISSKGAGKSEVVAKLQQIVNSKLGDASGVISSVVQLSCTVLDVVGAVTLLIGAQEALQLMSIVTSYFEAIDKVEAGDGKDAPIHELQESLTLKKPTTNIKYSEDDNSDEVEEEVIKGKERRSATQAEGFKSIYSNKPVDTNDPSVQNFNISSRLGNVFGILGTSVASFSACATAKIVAAAAGAITDFATIALGILTGGVGYILVKAGETAAQIGISVGMASVASAIIGQLVPVALKWFTRDLTSDLGGEDLGNAIPSAANIYMGNNHLQGGGSPASPTSYAQYSLAQQTVLAEKAKYERETRSPFDVTSTHTFLGSIMAKLATVQTVDSPIIGAFSAAGQMVTSSVMDLLPSASAYDVTENLMPPEEYEKVCPNLASIGAVGDAYCNPYLITDMNTINDDPIEVVDEVKRYGSNLDDDGNILDGGNLSKYIKSCSKRGSSFGAIDSNIAGEFTTDVQTGNGMLDTAVNATIGAVPVLGDALDIASSKMQRDNIDWIDGANCVARSSGEETGLMNSTSAVASTDLAAGASDAGGMWGEIRMYQRYIEDQRYLEGINPDYKSPVTAYYEKLDAENPIDDSYEGILAYKSGLTKEQVVDTLAFIEYYNYIDEYDPAERIAFGEENKVKKPIQLENESVTKFARVRGAIANLMAQISFADVRNRTVLA